MQQIAYLHIINWSKRMHIVIIIKIMVWKVRATPATQPLYTAHSTTGGHTDWGQCVQWPQTQHLSVDPCCNLNTHGSTCIFIVFSWGMMIVAELLLTHDPTQTMLLFTNMLNLYTAIGLVTTQRQSTSPVLWRWMHRKASGHTDTNSDSFSHENLLLSNTAQHSKDTTSHHS